MTAEELEQELEELIEMDPEVISYEGWEECCVGWSDSWHYNTRPIRLIYDYAKIIETMISRDGISHQDAIDHFEHNVGGGYVGPNTPIFINYFETT
jgi:hypothetical protein